MKTWDNKLLSPAQMACTLSYDNFMAEHHNSKIFGSREDTLARFLRTDEGFDDPILEQIVMLGDGYQEVLIEVSSDEFSPDKHENVDWLCQQATVDFKTAQVLCGLDIPSVTSMIARCANLSPKQSITDTPHHVENITSLVMRSPVWFQLWRNRVSAAPGDLHALLRRELSVGRLKDEGWTYSTLQDLFVQEYTSNGTPDTSIYCGKCQANINLSRMVEWEEYVDSTKNGSFHGCQDHMHLIRGTTVTIHDGKPQGLGIPHHIDSSRTFTQEHKFRACRNRRTPIRGQNKRYQDDLQFWNYGVSIYYSFREYRTRELYDIYAETGLCPLCAGEATGPGPDHEAVDGAEDQAEDQAEEEAEEEAVMLAPF
ncbi:hypothetical protein MMC11_003267 [Xylographa trunciseda]|nr:hypothetical protein [Xylographa trunciseda]